MAHHVALHIQFLTAITEFWQLLPIAHNSWLKFKKKNVFAIYRPYWIRLISLQHGWVDRYYGSDEEPSWQDLVKIIHICSTPDMDSAREIHI